MEFVVENVSNLERLINVSISAKEIDDKANKKLEELSKKVKLQGFRPGKVPFSVAKQRFGDETRKEVMAEAIQTSYFDILTKENLRPAGQPKIEPKEESKFGEPLEYTATFEVYPEIELHDLSGVKVEKITIKIKDEDVEKMVQKLRKQRAKWTEVKRASKFGDQLVIDFEGKIKGEAFDGGASKNFKFELGQGSMLESFEKSLIGAKAGDELKLKVKFPKDYGDDKVAGKKVDFDVKVHEVLESKLPELNNKLLEEMGIKKGSVEELRKKVRVNMEKQLEQVVAREFRNNVMDKLLELNPIELPKILVENEIHRLQQKAKHQFMQYTKQDKEQEIPDLPREKFEENAKKRVNLGLVLAKIVERDKIKADPAKMKARVEEFAKGYKNPAEVVSWYYNNKEYLAEIESVVLEEAVFDRLQKQVVVEEKKVSYEEAINA